MGTCREGRLGAVAEEILEVEKEQEKRDFDSGGGGGGGGRVEMVARRTSMKMGLNEPAKAEISLC